MEHIEHELAILISWHAESDLEKISAFEANRASFVKHNPEVPVITVLNTFEDKEQAWRSGDLTLLLWYVNEGKSFRSKRYLLVEWDCWCDGDLKDYFSLVWNFDCVVPNVKYYERDEWYWFRFIDNLPKRARYFATGVVPFCGLLLSNKAMKCISEEIFKPEYFGLISELRFPTVASMLGIHPIVNPVCNRVITWKNSSLFHDKFKGLHHPRKKLTHEDSV